MNPSEANECESTSNAEDDESLENDKTNSSIEMNLSRKKALLKLRCRVEDAILSNNLLDRDKQKSIFNGGRIDDHQHIEDPRDIALWGVPLLPSKSHTGTDIVLTKFLKAKDYKVSDAFSLLQQTVRWRKDLNVDEILNEKFNPELDKLGYIDGTDKEGRPLCYCVYSAFTKELAKRRFESGEKCEEFLRWKIQFLEKSAHKLSFKPGDVDTILQITDLKNTNGSSMKGVCWFNKKNSMLLQENYPGLLFKNIVMNCHLWYTAFHEVHRNRGKFIFATPSNVTKTLLKYISPEHIPAEYGGLKRENDDEFSPIDKVVELPVGKSAIEYIQMPAPKAGVTVVWDVLAVGNDVIYKEKFIPNDVYSYKVLLQDKKLGQSIRNSFYISERGRILIAIENGPFKKKKVFYRHKSKPTILLYSLKWLYVSSMISIFLCQCALFYFF